MVHTDERSTTQNGICAGIVTFNPDIGRLAENLSATLPQVGHVFVLDNGSLNIDRIREITAQANPPGRVTLVENRTNAGIAQALNQLCSLARNAGYSWVVTLDQDSVPEDSMVTNQRPYIADTVGLIAPKILDRNGKPSGAFSSRNNARSVVLTSAARKGAITSGALTNLRAVEAIGGYDESFFIDYVDYDLNKRLLLAGFQIVSVRDAQLLHECGAARQTWLRTPRKQADGRWTIERFYSFGHSSRRCYYKARNRVLYSRKYGIGDSISSLEGFAQIPAQILLVMLFEGGRRPKAIAFIRGIRDGLREPIEPTRREARQRSPRFGRGDF